MKRKIGEIGDNTGKELKKAKVNPKIVMVTGAAGFIGYTTCKKLLERGDTVIGVDNLNDYYEVSLKESRLEILKKFLNFHFYKYDITDYESMKSVCDKHKINVICHLAAQAGVRYSIKNPHIYEQVNLKGTLNMLEIARHYNIKEFVFASSSSVYGGITEYPYHEKMKVENPVSLYAATKRAGELMCYTYHHLYKIRFRCLRFFTVIGPYGRPDMALSHFAKKMLNNEQIDVYNYGKMERDFTYVDDIVSGVLLSIDSEYEYEIFNLGNGNPIKLLHFIELIEKHLGINAKKNLMPMQQGDVLKTFADISKSKKMLGYEPSTSADEAIRKTMEWYKQYYKK